MSAAENTQDIRQKIAEFMAEDDTSNKKVAMLIVLMQIETWQLCIESTEDYLETLKESLPFWLEISKTQYAQYLPARLKQYFATATDPTALPGAEVIENWKASECVQRIETAPQAISTFSVDEAVSWLKRTLSNVGEYVGTQAKRVEVIGAIRILVGLDDFYLCSLSTPTYYRWLEKAFPAYVEIWNKFPEHRLLFPARISEYISVEANQSVVPSKELIDSWKKAICLVPGAGIGIGTLGVPEAPVSIPPPPFGIPDNETGGPCSADGVQGRCRAKDYCPSASQGSCISTGDMCCLGDTGEVPPNIIIVTPQPMNGVKPSTTSFGWYAAIGVGAAILGMYSWYKFNRSMRKTRKGYRRK